MVVNTSFSFLGLLNTPSVASMWSLDLSMDENSEDDDLDIKDGDNNEKEEKYKEEIFATLALVGQIFLPP